MDAANLDKSAKIRFLRNWEIWHGMENKNVNNRASILTFDGIVKHIASKIDLLRLLSENLLI